MPAKPIDIGPLHFERKGDAIKFLQNILYTYELGDRVTAEHAKILTDLISMHPEASEKIGSGIMGFSVRSGDFGTQCFWVNRTDGTSDKFSFRTCL
ncbi:DCL family protein [Pseudaestuariivita rosea]|uniref:DCL family protein n=1 Tax=Pseudaestuariivita rosea TaxID=2763263 RepID=UPI001ABB259E|nr:DCL family protein [Pseudaestuariivita rosea]